MNINKFESTMEKFMSLSQLVMSIFMLIGTIVWGIAHLIKGTIGLFGFCVVLLFVYLIWIIVRESYREYQEEKTSKRMLLESKITVNGTTYRFIQDDEAYHNEFTL